MICWAYSRECHLFNGSFLTKCQGCGHTKDGTCLLEWDEWRVEKGSMFANFAAMPVFSLSRSLRSDVMDKLGCTLIVSL